MARIVDDHPVRAFGLLGKEMQRIDELLAREIVRERDGLDSTWRSALDTASASRWGLGRNGTDL